MRRFALWALATVAVFAAAAGFAHHDLSAQPARTLVLVDSSNPMQPVWGQVAQTVARLDGRYTVFKTVSDKGVAQDWATNPSVGNVSPYGPRNLARFAKMGADDAADRRILVTNAPDDELTAFEGWTIVRPGS